METLKTDPAVWRRSEGAWYILPEPVAWQLHENTLGSDYGPSVRVITTEMTKRMLRLETRRQHLVYPVKPVTGAYTSTAVEPPGSTTFLFRAITMEIAI